MDRDIYWISETQPLRLALMPRPRAGDWMADEVAAWRRAGIDIVVSLLESSEVQELGLADEQAECQRQGIEFDSFPIPDRGLPESIRQTRELVDRLVSHLQAGRGVSVHCRAGIGRSSIIVGCVLLSLGLPFDAVFPTISRARGASVPDTAEQVAWLDRFARELKLTQTGGQSPPKGLEGR